MRNWPPSIVRPPSETGPVRLPTWIAAVGLSVIAPEVQSLQLQYYDGTTWQSSWDSTVIGTDGITPLGPPAAIQITIGVQPTGPQAGNSSGLKNLRRPGGVSLQCS